MTQALPNTPLPAGAVCNDDWQPMTRHAYRWIHSPNRGITGHPAIVWSSAIQWADGSIDDGRIEAPCISVDITWEEGLSTEQARELAAALVESADEIDGWVASDGK
jgi:hypothetical protein